MYVKIIDKGECFSTTTEYIDGVFANKTEWAKHNFYPKNGMVGEVVKRTPSAFIVKILDGIYVPMTRRGIQEISYEEYVEGQSNNVCEGMDSQQQRINEQLDQLNALTGYNWQHLPDLRSSFKQDIVQNIKKLTCDFERNIFINDLEESAVIYALDMCLEYHNKFGRINPVVAQDIVHQVCDVYMELFDGQFRQVNKNNCISRIMSLYNSPKARAMVDNYYSQVNYRYNWH